MKKIICAAFILLIAASPMELKEAIKKDTSLVVPGVGASGLLVGDSLSVLMKRYGRETMARTAHGRGGELFRDVFKIDAGLEIAFDEIYYVRGRKVAAVIRGKRIVAIVSLRGRGITDLGVDISKGVESFVYRYGNRQMFWQKDGEHHIYLYPGKGIVLIDDEGDDAVDMFVVFKGEKDIKSTER